jgi:alpha-beta hydrolase superfamily lysophospholipase
MWALRSFAQLPSQLVKKDSTVRENYSYVMPRSGATDLKGVVVLLPGLLDHPLSILFESTLPERLNEIGYDVIIPVITAQNDRFNLTVEACAKTERLIVDYIQSKGMTRDIPVVLGGFSIGGTRVLRMLMNNIYERLHITRVFAIDPPLDIGRLLASNEKHGYADLSGLLEDEMDQPLDEVVLTAISVVRLDSLSDIPTDAFARVKTRIYNEPAIEWNIRDQKRDLLDLNLLDQSVYVQAIKRKLPEANIELILSKIPGMRQQTQVRNSHSWNIVDETELIDWITN